MKLIYRPAAIFFACFSFCYFLSSCKSPANLRENDKTGKMLVGRIKITDYDTKDSSLMLQDTSNQNATYVIVKKHQKIDWQVVGLRTKHIEIVAIYGDPVYSSSNDTNFFSANPNGNGKQWTAQIGTPDSAKPYYQYNIKWKLDSDTTIYTFDPLMQLNPK